MVAHRGADRQVLFDVMGHARVSVTDRVYKHLYDRQSAEANFRSAMGGARERNLGA